MFSLFSFCCIHVQAPDKVQGFCLIFLKAQTPNKAQSFGFFFLQSLSCKQSSRFFFFSFSKPSSKTSKLFTKLVSLLCSSIGISVFHALGCALLMVFFFTLTKLTFLTFLWWCLHGDGNSGNVNYQSLVHWFCCYS